jgi:hypothetical protein
MGRARSPLPPSSPPKRARSRAKNCTSRMPGDGVVGLSVVQHRDCEGLQRPCAVYRSKHRRQLPPAPMAATLLPPKPGSTVVLQLVEPLLLVSVPFSEGSFRVMWQRGKTGFLRLASAPVTGGSARGQALGSARRRRACAAPAPHWGALSCRPAAVTPQGSGTRCHGAQRTCAPVRLPSLRCTRSSPAAATRGSPECLPPVYGPNISYSLSRTGDGQKDHQQDRQDRRGLASVRPHGAARVCWRAAFCAKNYRVSLITRAQGHLPVPHERPGLAAAGQTSDVEPFALGMGPGPQARV